jgi:predicted  nucleic acid-binding Zn-ribbon protein
VSQPANLYYLQSLDSQVDSARERLAEIDRLLARNQAVRAAQAALETAEGAQRDWRTRLADLELEREKLKGEAEAAEKRLYSGKVHNPRELTDLQDKLAELNTRHKALEEPLLEAMLQSEECAESVQDAADNLERVKGEQAVQLGELNAEKAGLETQLAGLLAEVEQTRQEIEPEHRQLYDSLRGQMRGGIAVAAVKSGECGVCGVELTSQDKQRVRRGQVLTCTTCHRILYIS